MDIIFRTRKLARTFNSRSELQRRYGAQQARTIEMRLAVLRNAKTLSVVPTTRPERCHRLKGKRAGQYAVDLVHPHRLVFRAAHESPQRPNDEQLDTRDVTAITILDVIDYH